MRHLPAPARAIAAAAFDAETAVRAHSPDALDAAVLALAAADGSGLVLGAVVRLLLEERHPDGLDSDDIRAALEDCVRDAARWQPDVDPQVVLVLLASALGVYDPDEQSPLTAESLARHGALLVGWLLTAARRPLADYLTAAFTDIERSELHD